MSETCEFWVRTDEQCRRLAVVEYLDVSDVRGTKHISSNCAKHDQSAARQEAMARGWIRRDRRSLSVVADEFWQGDSA